MKSTDRQKTPSRRGRERRNAAVIAAWITGCKEGRMRTILAAEIAEKWEISVPTVYNILRKGGKR